MFSFSRSSCRLGRAAASALVGLGAVPASAIILPSVQDDEARARQSAKAHEEGKRFPFVVSMELTLVDPDCKATDTAAVALDQAATGVFLGCDAAGATGYVLTAAHILCPGGDLSKGHAAKRVTLSFGPGKEKDSAVLQVDAARAFIHPEFAYYSSPSLFGDGPQRMSRHDLAILAFDARPGREALARVEPAALYDGTGYAKPNLKAQVAGFGDTGTNDSLYVTREGRVLAGYTRVTYGEWRGWTGFRHVAIPTSAAMARASQSGVTDKWNWAQFQPVLKDFPLLAPDGKALFTLLSHEFQAMPSFGDSGGPLIFESKGAKVAGISSRLKLDACPIPGCSTARLQVIIATFESVKDHLPWIKAVQAGDPGKSVVLDLEGAPAAASAGTEAPAAGAGEGVERKAS